MDNRKNFTENMVRHGNRLSMVIVEFPSLQAFRKMSGCGTQGYALVVNRTALGYWLDWRNVEAFSILSAAVVLKLVTRAKLSVG